MIDDPENKGRVPVYCPDCKHFSHWEDDPPAPQRFNWLEKPLSHYLDDGELTLGVWRDSSLPIINHLQMFVEEFVSVVKVGIEDVVPAWYGDDSIDQEGE